MTDARLVQSTADTLVESNPGRRLIQSHADVLVGQSKPPHRLIQVHADVLVPPPLFLPPTVGYPSTLIGNGLGFWFDADMDPGSNGDAVSKIASGDGARHDATATTAVTVATASTPIGGKSFRLQNGVINMVSAAALGLIVSTVAQAGEMWLVVKSDGGAGPTAWEFGTDGSSSHYTYSGSVYDDFGNTVRRSFTPTIDPTSAFRLYRVGVKTDNTWFADINNVNQATIAGVTKAWQATPVLAGSFGGNMAGGVIIAGRTLNSTESSYMIDYFNTKYGLTVSGGVAPPPAFYPDAFGYPV